MLSTGALSRFRAAGLPANLNAAALTHLKFDHLRNNAANLVQARHGSQKMMKGAEQPAEEAGQLNVTKSSMKHTYHKESPLDYIQWLVPLDYGQFQDVFINFAEPMVKSLMEERQQQKQKLKIVDLGCLYGNSSLALMDNLSWKETMDFWLDTNKDVPVKMKSKYHVVGVDLSKEALRYGLDCNIYDEIFVQDFNSKFDDRLQQFIMDADVMICLMATNYMYEGRWAQIVNDLFLKERKKEKLLFYNQVCLFQKEDISPTQILKPQNNWEESKIFTKHRLLTPQESAANNMNKESWTYLYGVQLDKASTKFSTK